MADIEKIIEKVGKDGKKVFTNILDYETDFQVTYSQVFEYVDGTPMDDSKCDGKYLRKYRGDYLQLVVDDNIPYVTTIDDIRSSIGLAPYFHKRIVTTDLGQEGSWYLDKNDTTSGDNGGTVLVTETGLRLKREYFGYAKSDWWGVKADGVTDDTVALQRAINGSRKLELQQGIILVKDELTLPNNTEIIGKGNTWNANNMNTVIKYDGEGGADSCVLRISTSAVGIEPTSAKTNIKIRNIVVDGGNKAEYGIYSAYMTDDSAIREVTVKKTVKHGIRVEKCWYATFDTLIAKDNLGCGITIGMNNWGGVNGVTLNSIRTHQNGLDEAFNQTDNKLWGYGLGLFRGSDLIVTNLVSEKNYGAGLVINNVMEISGIRGGYFESNCSSFSEQWGILYISGSTSRGQFIEDVYLHGTHTSQPTQHIILNGVNGNSPLQINNVHYGRVRSDISGYNLTNCSYLITDYIQGEPPSNSVTGGYNLTTIYVRPFGDDNNTGTSSATAVKTLSRAVSLYRRLDRVVTIDCDKCDFVNEPTLNFSNINRPLTIDGGGTSTITNTSNGEGITLTNTSGKVTLTGFINIKRVIVTGENNNVTISNSNISINDGSNRACVYLQPSSLTSVVQLISVNLSGSESTFASPRAIDVFGGVVLSDVIYAGFTARRIRIYGRGSKIISNTNIEQANIEWYNNSYGLVVGGNKMVTPSGVVTFT